MLSLRPNKIYYGWMIHPYYDNKIMVPLSENKFKFFSLVFLVRETTIYPDGQNLIVRWYTLIIIFLLIL